MMFEVVQSRRLLAWYLGLMNGQVLQRLPEHFKVSAAISKVRKEENIWQVSFERFYPA